MVDVKSKISYKCLCNNDVKSYRVFPFFLTLITFFNHNFMGLGNEFVSNLAYSINDLDGNVITL